MVFVTLLVLAGAVVVFGVIYVPRHDGSFVDMLLMILIPTAIVAWCIARLLPVPSEANNDPKQKIAGPPH
jgi:hypothetical protein